MTSFKPVIIGFFCQWCAYAAADAAGRARKALPADLRVVRVMCSGRVDPGFVLQAFAGGADGVLIVGCLAGNCHYITGNNEALKRVALLKAVLDPLGIDAARVHMAGIGAEDPAGLAGIVIQFAEKIRYLGPLALSLGHQC
jgi:F420-non-reducing hydrogenase iron-sulfur subunit